jgi:hypothetical protein
MLILDKEVSKIVFDSEGELADTDKSNNVFPKEESKTKLDEFKEKDE